MTVIVTAAVIERDGRFLVTRRLKASHLEGYWEFPGGKCDAGETLDRLPGARTPRRARRRVATSARKSSRQRTPIPSARVELHFFRCELLGEPRPLLGQEMRWVRARGSRDARVSAGGRRADQRSYGQRGSARDDRRRVIADARPSRARLDESRGERSRARSARFSAGDAALLVTRPISRSPLRIVAPAAGIASPSSVSPTSFRATRPWPRCSTRMITSCPT